MKPLRIFIFLSTVALLLLFLALVFPPQGISLSPGVQLKFMRLEDMSRTEDQEISDVAELLLAAATVSEDPEANFSPLLPESLLPDSLSPAMADSVELMPYVPPANVDSLRAAVRPILFPEGMDSILHPFYSQLSALLSGERMRTRILHFGDSQIEIDRMTALIRYRLQRQFGGSGCGLVQAMPLYSGHHMAYHQEEEGEWLRYTYFGRRDTSIRHRSYGIMGAFTSVAPPKEGQWPSIAYDFNQKRRTGKFDRMVFFMHSYVEGGSLALVVNDTISDTIRSIPAGFSLVDYRHPELIDHLRLAASLPEGGRVYGISFESYRGIQMDNIAMRGGSGLIFSRMNRETQLRMLEYLRPGLIVLQYGGNVVPYINAGRYRKAFTRELLFLKDLCPGVPIIVIGPSDMSTKVKGEFVSYPGVEPVRDALKSAAMAAGCGFWDLYEAMGGENSMPSFVHSDPPLASSDYIHFTSLGVNLVAEMFYNALMMDYQHYLEMN